MRHLLCAILALLTVHQGSGLQKFLYKSSDITIKSGLHECISDCSTKLLTCQLEECGPETSSTSAPNPNIEDVHLERFMDPIADEIKLALYIKWKPKATGGIENTKGFLVDISDGKTTYTRCYSFATPLTMKNTEDEFYNDCFGKINGTSIKIGSTVTVNITSLPMAQNDPEQGRSTVVVNIPSCSHNDLAGVEECQEKGSQPTNEQCEENCNTVALVGYTAYPVKCSMSEDILGNLFENCPESNRSITGIPSHPRRTKEVGKEDWYIFRDSSGEMKVALNITWRPKRDSSIEHLLGYSIEVAPNKAPGTHLYKCFTIDTDLTEEMSANLVFFYDCYGRKSNLKVEPGDAFKVVIKSRRGSTSDSNDFLHLDINVPGCGHPRMENVGYCIRNRQRYLEGKIDRIACENRTIVYSYRVSPEYGDRATIGFCEKGQNSCQNTISLHENVEPSGTLYDLSLLSSANLSMNYSIFVEGDRYPTRHTVTTSLSECIEVEPISIVAIVMIALALFIFLLIITFFVWFVFYRHRYACGILRRFQDVYWSPLETYPDNYKPPVKIPGPVKVYIVFSEDHPLHKDVIHWFCTFLKRELGVDVRSSIWGAIDASVNRARYIMESMRDADKVVIICSPGGTGCLQSRNDDESDADLFFPAVNQAYQNLVARRNVDKYMVAYFGYSKRQDVPKPLLEQIELYSKAYNLMKQFEEFYFHLVGVEQYQSGGILRIKEIARYYDVNNQSDCSKKLHNAIEILSTYAQAYPKWHITDDKNGDATPAISVPDTANRTPQPVRQGSTNPVQTASNSNHLYEEPSISYLQMTAPPEAVAQKDIERRPKVMQTVQNPEYVKSHAEKPVYDAPPLQKATSPNHHDTSTQDIPTIQSYERSNPYPQASTAEWNSTKRMPLEHSEETQAPRQRESEMDSTGSSFEIPDTYLDSLSPSKAASKPQMEQNGTANPSSVPSYMRDVSYHADSFSPNDFPMSDFKSRMDSQFMNGLPSNLTEMTSVEPQSQEVEEQSMLIDKLVSPERVPSMEESPEAGLFKLANLDLDEDDIEDQIKSINVSSNFGLTQC